MDMKIMRPSYIGNFPYSRDPAAMTSSILDISIDLLLIFESVVKLNLRTFAFQVPLSAQSWKFDLAMGLNRLNPNWQPFL